MNRLHDLHLSTHTGWSSQHRFSLFCFVLFLNKSIWGVSSARIDFLQGCSMNPLKRTMFNVFLRDAKVLKMLTSFHLPVQNAPLSCLHRESSWCLTCGPHAAVWRILLVVFFKNTHKDTFYSEKGSNCVIFCLFRLCELNNDTVGSIWNKVVLTLRRHPHFW